MVWGCFEELQSDYIFQVKRSGSASGIDLLEFEHTEMLSFLA